MSYLRITDPNHLTIFASFEGANHLIFKDTFESPSTQKNARILSPGEQTFWRVIGTNADLVRLVGQLKARGRFEPVNAGATAYMSFRFSWNGQNREFDAQITPQTNGAQLRNFLETCWKGVNGVFEQPNIKPYLRVNRRPL